MTNLVFSLAVACYRWAIRLAARALPPKSADEQGAVFDALQHDAYAEGGWRAVCRYWASEAASLARIQLTGTAQTPASARSEWVSSIARDLRDAARSLGHAPAYATVVIAMFALGIGVNTAVFSLVDATLFKALPYASADRLVLLAEWPSRGPGGNWTVAPTMFRYWRTSARTLSEIEARIPQNVAFDNGGETEDAPGARVTAGYFKLLGVSAARGRLFDAQDATALAPCVVVITDRLWQRQLGRDPAALGRPLRLGGESCSLIGVLPADSVFDRGAPELYMPLVFSPAEAQSEGRQLTVLGRLRDGVTVEQATSELAGLAASYNATRGSAGMNWTARAFPWRDILIRTDARRLVWILFGAVFAVLTIACANVAGLALSRALLREREIAVRAALGAGRGRLIRTLVTESLVLALVAGAVALVVGSLALRAFVALVPPGTLPAEIVPSLDSRALVFTTLAAVCTGVISGLLPAWQAGRVTLTEALATTGRGFTAARRTSWAQSALLVAELALAMVLVTGSVLLTLSLSNLSGVQPGFDASHVLTLRLSASAPRYPSDEAVGVVITRVRQAIQAMPTVQAVGAVSSLPLGGWLFGTPFVLQGEPAPSRPPAAHLQITTPGYFEALHITLTSGRAFTDHDDARAPLVVIVNQTLVRRFISGMAVGQFLKLSATPDPKEPSWQIVGVIHNVKTGGLDDPDLATPEIYVPQAQAPNPVMFFAIRARQADAMQLLPDVRAAIRQVDPELPVGDVMTMDERIGASLRAERFRTSVIGGFAALAALLACFGAYAVRSRAVTARLREMGIRVALGATRRQIIQLALVQASGLGVVGLGAGLLMSWALSGYLRPWLFGTSAGDPLVISSAVVCLGVAVLLASWLPARRAGLVNPLAVLRDG